LSLIFQSQAAQSSNSAIFTSGSNSSSTAMILIFLSKKSTQSGRLLITRSISFFDTALDIAIFNIDHQLCHTDLKSNQLFNKYSVYSVDHNTSSLLSAALNNHHQKLFIVKCVGV